MNKGSCAVRWKGFPILSFVGLQFYLVGWCGIIASFVEEVAFEFGLEACVGYIWESL